MSQFAKSLKTRIQEITASLEAQKTELAAYEQLLQIELAKENGPIEAIPSEAWPQTRAVATAPIAQNHRTSPKKRKLSAAGLKAIREGVKKHWAAKRAAARKAAKSQ